MADFTSECSAAFAGTRNKFFSMERTVMSTTPQFEIPTDMRKMTEQSLEQVRKAINGYLNSVSAPFPAMLWDGSELSTKSSAMPSAMSRALSSLQKGWCR